MAYNKVWYHAAYSVTGASIGDMWRQLDAAGVPFGVIQRRERRAAGGSGAVSAKPKRSSTGCWRRMWPVPSVPG